MRLLRLRVASDIELVSSYPKGLCHEKGYRHEDDLDWSRIDGTDVFPSNQANLYVAFLLHMAFSARLVLESLGRARYASLMRNLP
jgi:hypothetical protein